MILPNKFKLEILQALSESQQQGATILEIEKKVSLERHTLSKYLLVLEHHGFLYHKTVGKAKLWYINKAPLQTVMNTIVGGKTFTEKVLQGILSALPLGLVIVDEHYHIQFMNAKAKQFFGECKGYFYQDILGKEHPLSISKITDLIDDKNSHVSLITKDKQNRIIAIHATKVHNPDDSCSILMLIDDLTIQKQLETEILEQKALLQAERDALNNAAIVAETDLRGVITYANDKFVEISGYQQEELLGKTHKIINSGHHTTEFFERLWRTISRGNVWKGLICNRRKDGTYYWVDSAIAPVLGKNGKPRKYIAIRFDVTKLIGKRSK